MKILCLILQILSILSGVVIYHLYWRVGIKDIVEYLMHNDAHIKDQDIKSNSELNFVINNSSVWCWGSSHLDRICYFHNLYFRSGEFFFVHGENSLYYGLPENQYNPALLDLSSVHDHNGQYFNYVDVNYENSVKLLNSSSNIFDLTFVLHRFHPDNLMHVFHDDLIPLFHTLETFAPFLGSNIQDVQLFLVDKRSPGKYKYLYEIMSSKKPLYKAMISNKAICFSKIFIGLAKNTTWYQYGFRKPQGPLLQHIDSYSLRKFVYFMRRKFHLEVDPQKQVNSAVLLVRKWNRLILNEIELIDKLVHDLGVKVEVMSEETHDLVDIVSKVSNAGVLVGMHGSLLILSLFLPPGAILMEMFPYAVDPDNYTPYKTLVRILEMNLSYASWRNLDLGKSRTHPRRTPLEGGIEHLSVKHQEEITSSMEVSLHLCCDDPQWLFRIYQDTEVNVEQVVELIAKYVNKFSGDDSSKLVQPIKRFQILPYRIMSIKCASNKDDLILSISWEAPINLDSVVGAGEFVYEIWLEEIDTKLYLRFQSSLNSCNLTHLDGINRATSYYVWIRGIANTNAVGPFNSFKVICTTK